MMFLKHLYACQCVVVALFLGLSHAAEGGGGGGGRKGNGGAAAEATTCSGPYTVTATSQLAKVTSCSTFSGDLVLKSLKLKSTKTISFGALTTVTGSLQFDKISLEPSDRLDPREFSGSGVEISLSKLEGVAGVLGFSNIDGLAMPSFPALASAGQLAFSDVTFVDTKSFTSDRLKSPTMIYELSFQGTNVASINFTNTVLTPPTTYPLSINITDNKDLSSITLNGYNGYDTGINIQGSASSSTASVEVLTASSLTLSGLSGFTASVLTTLGTSANSKQMLIQDNTFDSLTLPALKTMQAPVNIASNSDLKEISFPVLTSVDGTLSIVGNKKLTTLNLPSASAASSGSIVLTCTNSLTCNALGSDCTCASGAGPGSGVSSSSPSNTMGTSSSSSGKGGLSTGAKAGIGVGVGLAALILLGAVIFFCFRRRKSSGNTREISTGAYSKSPHSFGGSDEVTYTKVPYHSGSQGEMRQSHLQGYGQRNMMATGWSQSEQNMTPPDRNVELEEQQGMRHEMDARSLPDMDSDEDEEAETRSLEDIERVHGQR